MKLKTFLIVGCLGGLFTLSSCTAPTNVKDYSAYVNPFIGTGGHGHTFPGAVVPHGMIQPSPDTRIDGWDACSGYYYADSTINGFSHTHRYDELGIFLPNSHFLKHLEKHVQRAEEIIYAAN